MPEYEIRIKGHPLLKISNGDIRIDGRDFHSDIKELSSLLEILSGVLASAKEVKKPHLVCSENIPVEMPRCEIIPFPYQLISNC